MAKILVVDDELAEFLVGMVQCFGYETEQALSIQEALQKLKASPVDLVMLDMNLPDSKETQGLEKIRGVYPNLKVVMVTGNAGDDLEKRAKELGAAGYLLKPFVMEKLQQVLADALQQKEP